MPRPPATRDSARPIRRPRLSAFPQSAIRNSQSAIGSRRGLTMIEMLMATAITLLMMAAIVTLFANLSGGIRNRRAVIELSGQLRQARQRLARDLAGCTVPPGPGGLLPWQQRPGEAIGYFEVIEGNRSDRAPSRLIDGNLTNGELDYSITIIPGSQLSAVAPGNQSDGRGLGDYDDVLAFTTRSVDGAPFIAQVGNNRVESTLAEVIWYASENPADDPSTTQDETLDPQGRSREPGMRTIYRKVLLIAPWLPASGNRLENVSMHKELQPDGVSIRWVPNTLADLTRREFRYGHKYDPKNLATLFDYPHEFGDVSNQFHSEDLAVLSDALAFDVRVFDPGAPLYDNAGVIVDPCDPGWLPTVGASTPINFGAYVDVGWNNNYDYKATAAYPAPLFQFEHRAGWNATFGPDPNYINPSPANNPLRGGISVYDTWTWHYENDGIDEDGDGVDTNGDGRFDQNVDEGTNGRDDDGINGVDDIRERETSPPYPVPLRAVKVILRTYERDARQIREVSVTNSFVP